MGCGASGSQVKYVSNSPPPTQQVLKISDSEHSAIPALPLAITSLDCDSRSTSPRDNVEVMTSARSGKGCIFAMNGRRPSWLEIGYSGKWDVDEQGTQAHIDEHAGHVRFDASPHQRFVVESTGHCTWSDGLSVCHGELSENGMLILWDECPPWRRAAV